MSKLLNVKESFYTLQGEGARAGRASVFIRFSKCNLWNGKESGRETALCQFCDTDINGTDGLNGGSYRPAELLQLAIVESNGTLALPNNLDWVCISPKGKSKVIIKQCDELKIVYPQTDIQPEDVLHINADHYFISPMATYGLDNSGMIIRENMSSATQYCLQNPLWRMSLQTHKLLGID